MPSPATAFPTVLLRRPVVCMNFAAAVLDRDKKSVLMLVEQGDLPWAWNLAAETFTKQTVRILAQCIADFQQGHAHRTASMTPEEVFREIFPTGQAVRAGVVAKLKLCTIARRLCVGADHVTHLVDAGWLNPVAGSAPRRGPGGSQEIEQASLMAFMRKRRIA